MQNDSIMQILTFLGAVGALVVPIIQLNVNITKLNTNFENMMERDKERDNRITAHGKEIENIEKIVNIHEWRLKDLEVKNGIDVKDSMYK